jgi:hypothetical protein
MNVLGSLSHSANLHNGAGKDNIHTVLLACLVGSQSQIQNFVTVEIGLGADLKKGTLILCFAIKKLLLSHDGLPHYTNLLSFRQCYFAPNFRFVNYAYFPEGKIVKNAD